jgi:hypothetical protein
MQLFRKESIPLLIILILSAAAIVLGVQYYIQGQTLIAAQNASKTFQYDQKVLDFTKLFISKVLKASGDVSFDDRLQLETSVRGINDKEIFDQWQKFINAQTPLEAQIEVKNLLEMLINKISI